MLSNVKTNDTVIIKKSVWINHRDKRNIYELGTVEKVNKKTLSVCGNLYKIEDGKPVKALNEFLCIEPFSHDVFEKYAQEEHKYNTIQKAFSLMKKCSRMNYKQACKIIEALENKEQAND